tara:strand:- start:828 stop:1202 length:375 start_codon:yes stop_codon:yes gene_type:complete
MTKPRPDLIPADVLLACGRVLAAAWDKHGDPRTALDDPEHPNGTREANAASITRHLLAWRSGQIWDEETGEHHLAHLIVRAAYMASRDYRDRARELDQRKASTPDEWRTAPTSDLVRAWEETDD